MSLFFLIHITQVIRAGWNNFRAMVIGVEVANDQEADSWNRQRTGSRRPRIDKAPVDDLERRLRRLDRGAGSRRRAWRPWPASGAGAGSSPRSEEDGLPWPLRRVLEFNERVARGRLPRRRASRRNSLGPRRGCPASTARSGSNRPSTRPPGGSRSSGRRVQARGRFTLDEIKALPRVEMTTELRCIEGWSEVVHWAGARLADLAAVTGLATRDGRPADPGEGRRTCSTTRR